MAGGEPALRAVMQWIVVETRTAAQRIDVDLYMGLSDICYHLIDGDATEASQVNRGEAYFFRNIVPIDDGTRAYARQTCVITRKQAYRFFKTGV